MTVLIAFSGRTQKAQWCMPCAVSSFEMRREPSDDCGFRLLSIDTKRWLAKAYVLRLSPKPANYTYMAVSVSTSPKMIQSSRSTCHVSPLLLKRTMIPRHDCLLRLLRENPKTQPERRMTAFSAFLGLTKIIIRETMCRFFLQKYPFRSLMTVPSALWIQPYKKMIHEPALSS